MKSLNGWDKKDKMRFIKNLMNNDDKFYNDYTEELMIFLKDPDPEIRENAIQSLWEIPAPEFLEILRNLAENDPEPAVRKQAIIGLGRYMYEFDVILTEEGGFFPEYEEEVDFTREDLEGSRDFLIALYQNPEKSLDERRHALEALGFLDDDIVHTFIEQAYNSDELLLKVSALFAMGRNGDIGWEEHVLKEMQSKDDKVLFQAIRAAGELGLERAKKDLIQLTYSLDKDLVLEAIWALGKNGWSEAYERLDELTMNSDQDIKEMAETAMEEWNMVNNDYDHDEDNYEFNDDFPEDENFDFNDNVNDDDSEEDDDYDDDDDDDDFDTDFDDDDDYDDSDDDYDSDNDDFD